MFTFIVEPLYILGFLLLVHLIFRFITTVIVVSIRYDHIPYVLKLTTAAASTTNNNNSNALDNNTSIVDAPEVDTTAKINVNKKKSRGRSKSPASRRSIAQIKGTTKSNNKQINSLNNKDHSLYDQFNSDDGEEETDAEYKESLEIKNRAMQKIIVTGGCGLIGSETVRYLIGRGFKVVSIDKIDPLPFRKVDNCQYVKLDLVECSYEQLLAELNGATAICHCAGCICLYNDSILLHNQVLYLTSRLLCASKEAGIKAFVYSSTLALVHDGKKNYNNVDTTAQYVNPSPKDYFHSIHIETEKLVLNASRISPNTFRTTALRFPYVYGFKDNGPVDLMLQYGFSLFPARIDTRVDMLYAKNSAHANFCAIRALLHETHWLFACGKPHMVTQSSNGETISIFDFWKRARKVLGVHRPFILLPDILLYTMAFWVEFVFDFFCGLVPFRNSRIWNFTQLTVNYVLHDFTFAGQDQAYLTIGYRPIFNNEQSFVDIAEIDKEYHEELINALQLTNKRKSASAATTAFILSRNPLDDIDWTPREFQKTSFVYMFFGSFLGSGMTVHEFILFLVAIGGSVLYAISQLQDHWRIFQIIFCISSYIFNIGGAIQTTSATSKRHFHFGGKLSDALFIVILFEALIQCCLIGWIYIEDSLDMQRYIIATNILLLGGIYFLNKCVSLTVQRSYSVILFFIVMYVYDALIKVNHVPKIEGMEKIFPILVFKHFICHVPRHEPYKQDISW